MNPTLLSEITVAVLALLIGVEVIGKVPATLHTPLMSGTNAIHGIVLVGAATVTATATTTLTLVLGGIATAFAAMNVAGGYLVTDRMLAMFRTGANSPARPGGAS